MSGIRHHTVPISADIKSTGKPLRPTSVSELTVSARENQWDPDASLKQWLRTADHLRQAARLHVQEKNYEAAFIEFSRTSIIILERVLNHRDYNIKLNGEQRRNLSTVSISLVVFTLR